MGYIDDFENGNFSVQNSNWNDWSFTTGSNCEVVSTSLLSGNYAAKLYADSGSPNSSTTAIYTNRNSNTTTSLYVSLYIDGTSGSTWDNTNIELESGGTSLGYVRFDDGGDIIWNNNSGGGLTGWQTNKRYDVVFDFDFGNNEVDVTINGSTYSNLSLDNSANGYDYVEIKNNCDNGSRDIYVDEISEGSPIDAPATPTANWASADSGTQITFDWDPTDDWGGEEGDYMVYRNGSHLVTVNAGTTSYTDTGLSNGTTYDYKVLANNSAGSSDWSQTRSATTWDVPETPTLNSATADSDSQITIDWSPPSDWNGDTEHYNIYRNGSYYTNVGSGTTSYTDTGLNSGTTYDYEITAENAVGNSNYSNTKSATTLEAPTAPQNVNATVDANDQITVDWDAPSDWGGDTGSYDIRINRDGSGYSTPSGGPYNVSAGTTTATFTPNSDNAYDTQVGIDSSFQFRVRAKNSAGVSSWEHTSTVYTDPIPPHNPSVSRPDANTFEITVTNQSDIADGVYVQFREDTGSGYGNWTYLDWTNSSSGTDGGVNPRVKGNTFTLTYTTGTTYYYDNSMQEDARYQFRLRTGEDSEWVRSEWVYADYGNSGNVFFEDDFESGDLSAWDSVGSDVTVESSSRGDAGVSGADEGTYYAELDTSSDLRAYLGDLTGESDVIVKCAMAAGSLDNSSETADLDWYDGSSYRTLRDLRWEYNKQGWVEVTALVPDSWLSDGNWIRFRQTGGGGDWTLVDRVVVSDILHEYTRPADPSSLSISQDGGGGLSISWNSNASFTYSEEIDHKPTSESSWNDNGWHFSNPYTLSGLSDGEKYDVRVREMVRQERHGSATDYFRSGFKYSTGTTILPAPTNLYSPSHGFTSFDITWTDNHNYGDTEVQYKKTSDGSWTTWSTLSRNTESETLTGLEEGERYDVRVVAKTEHETKVDT
jgi:hypothetical protein